MSMRVLVLHNYYQQRGGEDMVVEAEVDLLRQHGSEVGTLFRHNDELKNVSGISAALNTFWSGNSGQQLQEKIEAFKPDVIHVHNTFPLLSPSVFWTAERLRVPIVQTLHNFRLLCPQATFLRNGQICEDCLGTSPWRGVSRRCYRGSLPASAVLAGMTTLHRSIGTFRKRVTRYIALNDFCRDKFIQGGLPAERISVKPNFVDLPVSSASEARRGGVYVGRLSPEKGVEVMWKALTTMSSGEGLKVIGGGPMADLLEGASNIRMLGQLPFGAVAQELSRASYLVLPSICYESFPRTLVEAYACGLPVIASRLGALAGLIDHQRTGLLFEPGNPAALAEAIRWAEANPEEMRRMGENARAEYLDYYSPENNVRQLLAIYARAINESTASQTGSG